VKLNPIFDTNVFGDVQRGRISQKDWRYLLRHRPRHGWPLSLITACELLVGVNVVKLNDFPDVRKRIGLAYDLSNGRVLADPRVLVCKEVLRVAAPTVMPSPLLIGKEMDVIRRANSLDQLLSKGVPYKGRLIGLVSATCFLDDMARPKKTWLTQTRAMATAIYPGWEELFQKTGRRLPLELRKELESRPYWERQRFVFSKSMLQRLGAANTPELVAQFGRNLDAVIEFSIFVVRQILLHNYSVEKHISDVFDQLQLLYLAIDKFVIVSSDADLSIRTRNSSQAARIMSFDQFLRTLSP
jgi:hypothetical protein